MEVVDSYPCTKFEIVQAQQVVEETYLSSGIKNIAGTYLHVVVEGIKKSRDWFVDEVCPPN